MDYNCLLAPPIGIFEDQFSKLTGSLNHGSKTYSAMILLKISLSNPRGSFSIVDHLHGSTLSIVGRHWLEAMIGSVSC